MSEGVADSRLVLRDWRGCSAWLCSLARWPTPRQQAWLSSDERQRAARFHAETHRRRYTAAHVWLRTLLGEHVGRAPHSLTLTPDALGKPQWREAAPALHFNLSHSGDWALVGIADTAPLGVDIEVHRTLDDAAALAQRHYTPEEGAACGDVGDARAFLRVWTRKEACMKAVGLGLRIAPSSFEAGAGPQARTAVLACPTGPRRVDVISVDVGVEAVAAVACVT